MDTKLPVSAVIITRNEAKKLPDCLRSVAFCAEILVVDSGSSDATVEIAQSHGARVVFQEWLGFGPQKQFAVDRASYDWVLCIDADERVSEALQLSLCAAMSSPAGIAYRFARCNRFLGHWLRHGEGYPDMSLRLFDRRHARWSDDLVHERVVVTGDVQTVPGDLLHESQETLDHYLQKQNCYTTLQARMLRARGKRFSLWKMLLSPLFRFIRFYFFRLGFLDGRAGLVHILIGCQNSFFKYAKLLETEE